MPKPTRRPVLLLAPLLLAPLLLAHPAAAQPSPAANPARYPQPIHAGDLAGRQLLRPIERQDILGRATAVVRRPDGALLLVVDLAPNRLAGLVGIFSRPVAIPLAAVALLGEHLAILDLSPDQLHALPAFDPASATPLAPTETIRVGLTKPFH